MRRRRLASWEFLDSRGRPKSIAKRASLEPIAQKTLKRMLSMKEEEFHSLAEKLFPNPKEFFSGVGVKPRPGETLGTYINGLYNSEKHRERMFAIVLNKKFPGLFRK